MTGHLSERTRWAIVMAFAIAMAWVEASDKVRFGLGINSGKLLQPATVELLQASQRLPSGQETGYGLGWALETVTLAGEQTTLVGHDGLWMGGPVASLMTFPKHGIVVAVTSNVAYADTFGIGVKVAQAFAEQGSHLVIDPKTDDNQKKVKIGN